MFAYIGPGMAGGIILSILGIILAIVISLFGILYFPIKRYLEKIKKRKIKKKLKSFLDNLQMFENLMCLAFF